MTKGYLVTVGSKTLGVVDNKYKISNLVKAYYAKRIKDAAADDEYAQLITELNDCIADLKDLDARLSTLVQMEDGGYFSWGKNNDFVVKYVSIFEEDSSVDLVKSMYGGEE